MDPIRPVSPLPPAAAVEGLRPLERPPGLAADAAGGERKALDPAVSIELSPDAAGPRPDDKADRAETERRGFERDADTQTLVFRITDAASGDVVVQIPDEVVLKARAYTRQPNAATGERVAKSA